MFTPKRAHQWHGHQVLHRRRHAEHELATQLARLRPDLVAHMCELGQQIGGTPLQQCARLGQRHAAFAAMENRHPEIGLERPYAARQCRLRHMQKRGGAREALELGDLQEIVQLADVHTLSLASGVWRPSGTTEDDAMSFARIVVTKA